MVGAPIIRSYGVAARTSARLDNSIDEFRQAQRKALFKSVMSFSTGEIAAALALAAVVIFGAQLGIGGELSMGQLMAFLFLVTLFIQPVQIATEVLNEAQNAIAGWRRVLDVLDLQARRGRPRRAGHRPARGPA